MKTAVEWYDTQLKELDYKLQSGLINWTQCKGLMVEAREQAKKMENEQNISFLEWIRYNPIVIEDGWQFDGKFYTDEEILKFYTKTFKQQEQ